MLSLLLATITTIGPAPMKPPAPRPTPIRLAWHEYEQPCRPEGLVRRKGM